MKEMLYIISRYEKDKLSNRDRDFLLKVKNLLQTTIGVLNNRDDRKLQLQIMEQNLLIMRAHDENLNRYWS